MPPRVSREEWERRAAAVGIEWVEGRPTRSGVKHPARCITCGRQWDVEPNSVTKGNGCRKCAGIARRVDPEEWDRRADALGLAWVGDDPVLSMYKHAARCMTCDHVWMVLPKDVTRGHGCPACSGNIRGGTGVSREEWDRRARDLSLEWIGDETLFALTKHAARCLECGYEWEKRPSDVHRGSGCPACVGLARISQEQWAERAAAAGIEWIGDEPVRQRDRHAARCLNAGHEYNAWPGVIAKGNGCQTCANDERRLGREEWDRRAMAVGIQWIGDEPVLGDTKHAARCLTCGYEWEARPVGVSSGEGCPGCAPNTPVAREEWDRRAAAVDIEWIGDAPVRSSSKHLARCIPCGHEWGLLPSSATAGTALCPACTQRRKQAEWKRRAAARRIEWIGDEPIWAVIRHPARCLQCGYTWQPVPSQVTWFGCPGCAKPGFDPSSPGTVYLIRHDTGPYMKVGITGSDPSKRINGWLDLGWEVVGTWAIPVGRDAQAIERVVVTWWKDSGARRCTRDELPDGQGWTEAVHITAAADEPRTIDYIEELVAEVGGGY